MQLPFRERSQAHKMQSDENRKEVIQLRETIITVNGISDTIDGWSERIGLSVSRIRQLLQTGRKLEDILNPNALTDSSIRQKKKMLEELWHGRWVYVG